MVLFLSKGPIVKKFVRRHQISLSVVTGIIFGIAVRNLVTPSKRIDEAILDLYITPDQVSQMVFEGGGHIRFDTTYGPVKVRIMDDPE